MATGGVELAKLLDGLNKGAAYVQSNYKISLSCTSAGQAFEPMNSDGSLRNPFTITAGSAATQGGNIFVSAAGFLKLDDTLRVGEPVAISLST